MVRDYRDEDRPKFRRTTRQLVARAREFRHNPTEAEEALWRALRGKRLYGLRIRRQHPVGNCIADFYCPSARLVIEVDGGIHQAQRDRDLGRTLEFVRYGYRLVRITNQDVLHEIDSVLERIAKAAGVGPK